jgi:hypothetical protein
VRKKNVLRRTALTPTRWAGVRMLETAHRLNGRCFALLAESARRETAGIECHAVYGLKELWAQVDARACERAGSCPVLLLNLNLQRPASWSNVHSGKAVGPRVIRPSTLFTTEQVAPLLREIVLEAWSIARCMPSAANLLFGMAPQVTKALASLSVPDVDRVVVEHAQSLRPRWERSRPFWKHLLEVAIGIDDEALADIHLHCFQLLGSELTQRYE